ncbi:MAG TPA: sulfite exporter TauE/SafE family protein, partial [Burkholderiales bacterium]
TSVAALRYSRSVSIRWGAALPAALSAFAFSFLGARTVALLPSQVMRPLVLVLLVVMAVFTLVRKDFGSVHAPRHEGFTERVYAVLLGGAIGFYDGFFGPGTGTFLVFLFVRFFGFDFLGASAAAKVVNVATNAAALLYFGFTGNILYLVAIPMALCNAAGAVTGSRLAIHRGSGFVRWVFLGVVSVLIVKFAWESFLR